MDLYITNALNVDISLMFHIQRRKKKKGEKRLSLTLSKRELMNRSLTAMTINIGKAGLNDNVIEEIRRQLKSQEIVKIKFSRNISSKKDEFAEEIVAKTKSKLVDMRGNVAVIYKKKWLF